MTDVTTREPLLVVATLPDMPNFDFAKDGLCSAALIDDVIAHKDPQLRQRLYEHQISVLPGMEANLVVIKKRATDKAAEFIKAGWESGELKRGANLSSFNEASIDIAKESQKTLAEAGIDKTTAQRARRQIKKADNEARGDASPAPRTRKSRETNVTKERTESTSLVFENVQAMRAFGVATDLDGILAAILSKDPAALLAAAKTIEPVVATWSLIDAALDQKRIAELEKENAALIAANRNLIERVDAISTERDTLKSDLQDTVKIPTDDAMSAQHAKIVSQLWMKLTDEDRKRISGAAAVKQTEVTEVNIKSVWSAMPPKKRQMLVEDIAINLEDEGKFEVLRSCIGGLSTSSRARIIFKAADMDTPENQNLLRTKIAHLVSLPNAKAATPNVPAVRPVNGEVLAPNGHRGGAGHPGEGSIGLNPDGSPMKRAGYGELLDKKNQGRRIDGGKGRLPGRF